MYKYSSIILVVCIILVCSLTINAEEDIFYIRAGATGKNDGSDWTNAWTDLPETLERGAIYYIAAGTYGPHLFDDEEVGEQVITIKKATIDDHGIDQSWENSYTSVGS